MSPNRQINKVDIEKKAALAKSLFEEKHLNCSQAVVGAFAEDIGCDVDTLVRIASPFGGGFGRLREVCGTFSGVIFVLGALYGYSDSGEDGKKSELYVKVRALAEEFSEVHGSVVCRDILGLKAGEKGGEPEKRTPDFYSRRPCSGCVQTAARLAAKLINEYSE